MLAHGKVHDVQPSFDGRVDLDITFSMLLFRPCNTEWQTKVGKNRLAEPRGKVAADEVLGRDSVKVFSNGFNVEAHSRLIDLFSIVFLHIPRSVIGQDDRHLLLLEWEVRYRPVPAYEWKTRHANSQTNPLAFPFS
jgi:hypothetical protein